MSNFVKLGFLVVLSSILAACASQGHLADSYGNAVRKNQQVQIFNPDAAKGPEHAVMLDGQKAEQVIEGYRNETGDVETGRLIEGVSR